VDVGPEAAKPHRDTVSSPTEALSAGRGRSWTRCLKRSLRVLSEGLISRTSESPLTDSTVDPLLTMLHKCSIRAFGFPGGDSASAGDMRPLSRSKICVRSGSL